MDAPLGDQIVALILTLLAVIIAGLIWFDMYTHGMVAAAPRDVSGLALLALIRWMLGKFVRTIGPATPAPAPVTTEGD